MWSLLHMCCCQISEVDEQIQGSHCFFTCELLHFQPVFEVESRIFWIHNRECLFLWLDHKHEGKKLTVCLKWHITKTKKGSGPYALDCKHTAVFVTVWLGSNDITGKKSEVSCFSLCFYCVCALISAVDHDRARAVVESTGSRSETSVITRNDH